MGQRDISAKWLLSEHTPNVISPMMVAIMMARGDDSPKAYRDMKIINDDILKKDHAFFVGLSRITQAEDSWNNQDAMDQCTALRGEHLTSLEFDSGVRESVLGHLMTMKPKLLENAMTMKALYLTQVTMLNMVWMHLPLRSQRQSKLASTIQEEEYVHRDAA